MASIPEERRRALLAASAAAGAGLSIAYFVVSATGGYGTAVGVAVLRVLAWAPLSAVPWFMPPHRLRSAARLVSSAALATTVLLLLWTPLRR